MRPWFSKKLSDRSAGLGLSLRGLSAETCSVRANMHSALHVSGADGHVKTRLMEPAAWSISAPPSDAQLTRIHAYLIIQF